MMLNNVDLNKLRVFHAVVKYGSFRLAGEDLGLTRSAISQSISTLEGQIGVKLFQRKGRRLYPTEKAKNLAKEFERSQQILVKSLEQVCDIDQQVEGLIKLGAYYEFAKNILSVKIKKFVTDQPGAQFKFLFASPTRLQNYLESNRVDLNFSIYPYEGSSDIVSKKVYQQELVLVSSNKLSAQVTGLSGLESVPIIDYYTSHTLMPKWIYKHYKKKPRNLNIKYYAASAEMALKLIELELGVGILPKYVFDSYASKKLKIIRPTSKQIIDFIWLNQYKNQFANQAHRKFYEFISMDIN